MPEPMLLLILLCSPAVGSFLGVLADRLPRGENVVHPRSFCRVCHTQLRAADLVPLLSYVGSKGRCRHCGADIAPWHFFIELAAFGAALLAIALGGGTLVLALSALVLWCLLGLALTDGLWFRLPDVLTGTLLAAALLLTFQPIPQTPNLPNALIGGLVGAGSFWVLRVGYFYLRGREGLGLGDVKLMAGVGALLGPWLIPHVVLLAALGALGAALLQRRRRADAVAATRALPFGTALCVATFLLWSLTRAGVAI